MHPILFHVGSIPVRSYGTLIMIGFLIALRYTLWAARRRGSQNARTGGAQISGDDVFDMALVGLVAGIIGARLVYVALNWSAFRAEPLEIVKLWTGGMSFVGAPVFGFGYACLYCRRRRLSFPAVADLGAPGFALAYAFGRIGCFLNGCCYGHPCELPWATRFPAEGLVGVLTPPSHPTQIYAAIVSLGMFAVLHRSLMRPHRDGAVFWSYVAMYAAYRFAIDWLRAGATAKVVLLGMTDGQVGALAAAPLILYGLWRTMRAPASPE